MSLLAGYTYTTVGEADTYAGVRPSWTAWASATAEQKVAARQEAARYLDFSYAWKGEIASSAQVEAWPRTGVIDREGRELSSSEVPEAIKVAEIELANIALAQALVENASSGEVASVTAGSVSISFKDGGAAQESDRLKSIDRIVGGLYESRADMKTNIRNAPLRRV